MSGRLPRSIPVAIVRAVFALAVVSTPAAAQQPAPLPLPTAILPAAIYWKQDLFLIPYQGVATPGASAAQSVRLAVSTDRGTTWQTICEAKPHVKAFNYRAPGDGEYWFSVRAVDAAGRTWPATPYAPELRVIVDKTTPNIGAASAIVQDDGTLQLKWSATDANLDSASWRWEMQADASTAWQTITLPNVPSATAGAAAGSGEWRAPPGVRPAALRATVSDLAGNLATINVAIAKPLPDQFAAQTPSATPQWTSASASQAAATGSAAMTPTQVSKDPAETQAWPASLANHSPYRLYDNAAQTPNDTISRYGNPPHFTAAPNERAAQIAVPISPDAVQDAPLEPFRQATFRRLPPTGEAAQINEPTAGSADQDKPNSKLPSPSGPVPASSKQVASRTFDLEYHFENVGRWGVSRVELWGTRNGGQSWRRYAEDPDLRSPLRVTVEEEGRYGFRIVAEAAGDTPPAPPQPGDVPELWIDVDLHRPYAEITSLEAGSGNQADHAVIHWRAEDSNLEARPVSLYYSSRPVGPWSAIATNLENTGEYPWRIERYLPDRCYLRLEVRDAAGNIGAFQTTEAAPLGAYTLRSQLGNVSAVDSEAAANSSPAR